MVSVALLSDWSGLISCLPIYKLLELALVSSFFFPWSRGQIHGCWRDLVISCLQHLSLMLRVIRKARKGPSTMSDLLQEFVSSCITGGICALFGFCL